MGALALEALVLALYSLVVAMPGIVSWYVSESYAWAAQHGE